MLEPLKPQAAFNAGVTVEIKRAPNNQLAVVLTGPALDSVLQASNLTELVFVSTFTEMNKLASICSQSARLLATITQE